jgi:hypothetical protein
LRSLNRVSTSGRVAGYSQHYGLEASKLETPFKRESGLVVQHLVPKMLFVKYQLRSEEHDARESLTHLVSQPFQFVDRVGA